MDMLIQITSDAGPHLQTSSERRISPQWTLQHLKQRLEPVTGIPPQRQLLTLFLPQHTRAEQGLPMQQDDQLVSDWPLEPHARVHIVDSAVERNGYEAEEADGTERVEMPLEEYEKRTDSVLAWKKRNLLGRFDPAREDRSSPDNVIESQDVGITTGQRCRIGDRRGRVEYVGTVEGIAPGTWIGVNYDEPVGKNDGSFADKRYFSARPRHGGFVRPPRVEVGDFPELLEQDLQDSDLEEM